MTLTSNPVALGVTAALCVAIFLLACRRPQWGIITIAGLVPFHGLLIIYPIAETFWKEAAVLAVGVACFFATPSKSRVSVVPWLGPALLLVVVGIISGVTTLGINAAFPVKIAFFFLIPAVIIYYFPFTRSDKDTLLNVLLGTGLISALYGVWQQLVGGYRLVELGYEWNEHIRSAGPLLRSIGTFNQPFPLAFFMMLVLVLGGTVALSEPGRFRSKFFWIISPILVFALATTVVRAAFLGFLAAVIVVGAILHQRLLKYLLGLAIVTTVGLPVVLVLDRQGVLATMFSSSSLLERGGHWQTTFPEILTRPFGSGLGTTGSAAEKVSETSNLQISVYQPDNQYLKIILEMGFIGLALYAVTIAVAIVVLRRLSTIHTDPLEQAYTVATLGMTVAALIAAAFSTYLEIFPMDFYFWVLLAVASSAERSHAMKVGGWSHTRQRQEHQ